ncbi:MAG: HPr family phosphocarrier protein [Candidatus Omnitrophica bacterium]|nr:HPr family phosphocarrier protein [Candidatus Omnitrophota bacterium]
MPQVKGKAKKAAPCVTKRLFIRSRQGLHARPAALFVQVANRFKSAIRVRKGRRTVDGKSIMGILTLAAERGSPIELTVDGPDAEEALRMLEQILCHEEPPAVVHVLRAGSEHRHGS